MGILKKIETVRQELYALIKENASYDSIYCKSTELDLLINKYYILNQV
ncbi:MAG TPA: aspartyl-phosphate phosphatase Spo0E family protein [Patescibacteria group bacterium]|nr:aspartyl-phosphate phosphatase Spo0E family protein [Patescibacteria group bacterium]